MFLMVPKSGVGRAWEGSKCSVKKGLGASWLPRVGWEGSGKPKMKHEKRGWVLHGPQEWGGKGLGKLKMVSKSVVGMGWKIQKKKHEKNAKSEA